MSGGGGEGGDGVSDCFLLLEAELLMWMQTTDLDIWVQLGWRMNFGASDGAEKSRRIKLNSILHIKENLAVFRASLVGGCSRKI